MDSGNFDKNNRYSLFVSSNADGKTPVSLWADPITHALVVSGASGSGGLTDTQLRASPVPVSGTITVSNPTTNPETGLAKDSSLTTIDTDIKSNITLHAGTNLIGKAGIDQTTDGTTNKVFVGNIPHVIVDSAPTTAVTGTFFQATQPVSLASNTPDVTDRAARLLGHVTVDNASIAVTGTFFQVTQPVSLATNQPTLQSGSTTTVTQATGTNLHVVVDSAPSTAVTNTGTFAVQATLAAETTKVIGTVNQGTSPWVTNDPGIPDSLGQKAMTSSTGVVIASDQTAVPVSGTFFQSTQPVSLATNTPTLQSGSTTAVTQPTGTNLHTVVDSGTITTVSTLTTITNPVPTKEQPDATSTYAPTNASNTAYATNLVIKASAGVLFGITGYNSKTSAQFIQLHNTTSLPADTAVPALIFTVAASSNFSLDFGKFGRFFSTGITICNSSTGPTKTVGSADIWVDAQYS